MATTVDMIWSCLMMMGGMCFIFGVAYPVAALIGYPVYRRLGGKMTLGEYMRGL